MASLLAGCSTPPPTEDVFDPGTRPTLPPTKGAIAGLLIDDRYRPVPDTLVLLTPTGDTATTDWSGQFAFFDLEPGAYLLQIGSSTHEAAPRAIDVVAAEYSEVEYQGRRVVGTSSDLVTTQVSVFAPCAVSAVIVTGLIRCIPDGDSYEWGFTHDFTPHGKNATFLVIEFLASQADGYFIPVGSDCGDAYAGETFEGRYMRYVFPLANKTAKDNSNDGYDPWRNDCAQVGATMFYVGSAHGVIKDTIGARWGVGARLAIKGTFLSTLFVGEPLVDIATYAPMEPQT